MFGEQQNYHTTSDSSDDNLYTKKRKYKPYEEISGEFKKIKPPTFNGKTEKGGGIWIMVIRDEEVLANIELF